MPDFMTTKMAWAKLFVGLALAIVGVITQFNVTINKNTTVQPTKTVAAKPVKQTLVVPSAPTRTYMPEAVCRAIGHDTKIEDLLARYKTKRDQTGLLWWTFELAEDHDRDCTVHHDDEHVEAVDLLILKFDR